MGNVCQKRTSRLLLLIKLACHFIKCRAKLVKLGVEGGHEANDKIVCGVCGETGGDPDSIQMYYDLGLDYVSCSPFRVPIARLAAAQAKIKSNGGAR